MTEIAADYLATSSYKCISQKGQLTVLSEYNDEELHNLNAEEFEINILLTHLLMRRKAPCYQKQEATVEGTFPSRPIHQKMTRYVDPVHTIIFIDLAHH